MIDILPDPSLTLTLEHLGLREVFRLRYISRHWKAIIDELFLAKKKDLLITCFDGQPYNRWFYSDSRLSLKNDAAIGLNFSISVRKFETLQRLKICLPFFNHRDLAEISTHFPQLMQLDIDCEVFCESKSELKFPTLKILSIMSINEKSVFNLLFNAPLLSVLYCGFQAMNFITMHDPTTVRHLEFAIDTDSYSLEFQKVEVLKCNRVLDFNRRHLFNFLDLTRLKELHCNVNEMVHLNDVFVYDFNRAFEIGIELLKAHSKAKIFIQGLKFTNDLPFVEFEKDVEILELYNLIAKSAREIKQSTFLIDKISSLRSLNFQIYLTHVDPNSESGRSFYLRYPNIQEIQFCEVYERSEIKSWRISEIQNRLIEFIAHYRIQSLKVINSGFSSKWYAELLKRVPHLSNTLICLKIFDKLQFFSSCFNFDFLFQLERLHSFATNADVFKTSYKITQTILHPCRIIFLQSKELYNVLILIEKLGKDSYTYEITMNDHLNDKEVISKSSSSCKFKRLYEELNYLNDKIQNKNDMYFYYSI